MPARMLGLPHHEAAPLFRSTRQATTRTGQKTKNKTRSGLTGAMVRYGQANDVPYAAVTSNTRPLLVKFKDAFGQIGEDQKLPLY